MERRHFNRKKVSLNVELISGDTSHLGFIENVSEEGLHLKTAPSRTEIDCTPGTILELKFQLPSKETLNLHCKVVWAYKTPHEGLTSSLKVDPAPEYTTMGMQIIDPPSKYKKFISSLN